MFFGPLAKAGGFLYLYVMNLQEQISRIKEVMVKNDIHITVKEQKVDEVNWDDVVDIISGVADGIPGTGNLVSLGLDLGHTLSYFYRSYYAKDEFEKIEYALLGIMTACMAYVPVAGNATNIILRQGISGLLKKTPDDIIRWAISKGIINYRVLFGKDKFKYSILLLMVRLFKDEAIEYLSAAIKNLGALMNGLEKYSYLPGVTEVIKYISKIVNVLKDINNPELIKIAEEVLKKSNNLTNFD